jgi:hypothetical protein
MEVMDILSRAESVEEEELCNKFGIVTDDDGVLANSSRAVRGTVIDILWEVEPIGIT